MRLKELRKNAGLTQTQFANEIGAAQNTVSQWESGARRLDDETIKQIAAYFNVSVDYLLGLSDDKKNNLAGNTSEDRRAMKELVDRLSDEQIKKLLQIANAALDL